MTLTNSSQWSHEDKVGYGGNEGEVEMTVCSRDKELRRSAGKGEIEME